MSSPLRDRGWSDRDWKSLLATISEGKCILLLGPDVRAMDRGGTKQNLFEVLSSTLADDLEDVPDPLDFPDVCRRFVSENGRTDLEIAVEEFYEREVTPGDHDPTFEALAKLPLPLIVTSRHDSTLEHFLKREGRTPIVEGYNFRGDKKDLTVRGTAERPLLYHLYGWTRERSSMVLTEIDLLDFLSAVVGGDPPLPDVVKSEFQKRGTTFLFLGFGLRHWYLRILLHVLRGTNKSESRSFALEAFPQAQGGDDQETVMFYKRGYRIDMYAGETEDFIIELADRWSKESATSSSDESATTPAAGAPKVFISYIKEDEPVAKALYRSMAQGGLDPWMDTEGLHGGDKWDDVLHEQVDNADYFVVIQSQNLAARSFSYVGEELNIAMKKQRRAMAGIKFIFPVVVDDTEPLVDLKELQRTVVRSEEDRTTLVKEIARDFQRRLRG